MIANLWTVIANLWVFGAILVVLATTCGFWGVILWLLVVILYLNAWAAELGR